jgi:hypothetical protein
MLFGKSFLLAFTALLPVTNPMGCCFKFLLGLIGNESASVFLS